MTSNGKAGSKDTTEQKWCSLHKTTTHDDAERYAQGAPRGRRWPSQNDGAHLTVSVVLCASTPLADDNNQKLGFNFDGDFDKGLSFTGLLASNGERGIHSNSDRFTMNVDSGA